LISRYSSALTTNSLTYTRYQANGRYYYEAIRISVSGYGLYTLQSNSTVDSYGYLYLNEFNPLNPRKNLITDDDDGAGNSQFSITYVLQPNDIYILIQTTYLENKITSFSITASGSGTVYFNRMNGPPAPSRNTI
jgi:hypothetical protein